MKKLKSLSPGLLLCLGIAVPAWFVGKAIPVIGSPVFGILFGMTIASAFPKIRPDLEGGIKFTSKKILQYSIILLGFDMNLFNVLKVGSQSLLVMLFTISASLIMAFAVGKALKVDGKIATLIGVGTSICGGSAIAATAPVIQAEDAEVAHAISTIFLFNIVAVFLFPPLGRLLGMSDTGFGMWAGTAINDTSSVVAASAAWSSASGNDAALKFATIVKLTRTLMIVPIVLALAVYRTRKSRREEGGAGFTFAKVFPWFVLGFAAAALLNTFAGIPAPFAKTLFTLGKFMIVMAMAAIGLNTNLKKLLANGFKPIFLGLCCWLAVALTSLLVQTITKMW
jgi:uncharacterized integral membrane protein (TIGR00698 family)